MADFTSSNLVLRARPAYTLVAMGDQIAAVSTASGKVIGTMISRGAIMDNARHFLRANKAVMDALSGDDAAGVISVRIDGKDGIIIVTRAEYADAALERQSYADWARAVQAARTHWDGQNEYGGGFNPYR